MHRGYDFSLKSNQCNAEMTEEQLQKLCTFTYTAHTYQFPSSPWAGALDRHKGLSAGVQSRLDPFPQ